MKFRFHAPIVLLTIDPRSDLMDGQHFELRAPYPWKRELGKHGVGGWVRADSGDKFVLFAAADLEPIDEEARAWWVEHSL